MGSCINSAKSLRSRNRRSWDHLLLAVVRVHSSSVIGLQSCYMICCCKEYLASLLLLTITVFLIFRKVLIKIGVLLLQVRLKKYGGWQLQRQWVKVYFYLQSRDLIVSAYSWNWYEPRAAVLAWCEMLCCWSASGQHLLCKGDGSQFLYIVKPRIQGNRKQEAAAPLKKMWLPTSGTVKWVSSSNFVLFPQVLAAMFWVFLSLPSCAY